MALFDDAQMPFGDERVHFVVMAQHLARLAVQAFELLELAVVVGGVMGDPRGLDEIAPLIDERTLVILLLGGLVDPVEQVRRSAAGDERIV